MDLIFRLIIKIFEEVFSQDRKRRTQQLPLTSSQEKKEKKEKKSFLEEKEALLNDWLKKQYHKQREFQSEMSKLFGQPMDIQVSDRPLYHEEEKEEVLSPQEPVVQSPSASPKATFLQTKKLRANRPTLKDMIVSQVILGPPKAVERLNATNLKRY